MLHGKNLPIEWVPPRELSDEEFMDMVRSHWDAWADSRRRRALAIIGRQDVDNDDRVQSRSFMGRIFGSWLNDPSHAL